MIGDGEAGRIARGSGLVLVGYRGTGKSTVGRIVAERTQAPFADADLELERAEGRSIRTIFDGDGEGEFRRIEASTLARLVATPELTGGVLSTGGGAILAEANRRAIRAFGLVVWLTADADVLAERLARSHHAVGDRPALTAAGTLGEVAAVLAHRAPLYQAAADVAVVSGGRSVHEVVDVVIDAWNRANAARRAARHEGATR